MNIYAERFLRAALLTVTLLLGFDIFGGEVLDLERTRELTLANSRSLAKYNLSGKTSELDEKSRIYSNLPSLSLGASASLSLWGEQKLPEMEPGMSSAEGIQDSFSTGINLSVSQRIYDGGKNGVLKSINGISSGIIRQEALAEYYAALEAAEAAYFGTLEAVSALAGAEADLEMSSTALSAAESRRDMGMISYGDYLEALANKESRETSRNQARREVSLWKLKLTNLTGVSNPEVRGFDFDAYEDIIQRLANIKDEEIDGLYRSVAEFAAKRNPTLVKAGLLSEQAARNVSLAKRDYFPTLSASFSTGINYGVSGGPSLSGGRFSLSGSIPLDFWVTGNNVAKKELAREDAGINFQSAEHTLALDIQTAALNALAQAGTVLSSRRASEASLRNLEYAQELFNLSQNSVSNLLDAAALASSSATQLVNAQFGFLSSLSKLRSLGAFSSDQELFEALMRNP